MTNRDRQDMIDGITQLAILKRKAAFDAIVEHGINVVPFRSEWVAYDMFGSRLTSGRDTPLESVEAALEKLGET